MGIVGLFVFCVCAPAPVIGSMPKGTKGLGNVVVDIIVSVCVCLYMLYMWFNFSLHVFVFFSRKRHRKAIL